MSDFVPIFVIDDDHVDIETLRRMLQREGINNPLYTARDGVEALEMLGRREGASQVPQPCLVLLDINMPRMNGLELLKELRNDRESTQNIVFVLSTSIRDEDLRAAFNLNSAGYILKDRMSDLPNLIRQLFQVCEFPPPSYQGTAD